MKRLAERGNKISASKTLALAAKAKRMKSEGKDVISLTVGEPDFPTPQNIKDAAFKAINENFTHYTAASGIDELKQAVVDKYKNEFGVEYTKDNIVISNGAKQSLSNAILAICEEGDEVLIPTPSWVSYPELVKLADATPVTFFVGDDKEFKIDAQLLREQITEKTKMLLLCSPSNPCGTVYSVEELREIANVIKESGIYVIFDEIYEKLVYDGFIHHSMTEFEDIKDQVISINGVSKAYAMTGWRIGYSVASKEISSIAKKIQSHQTSGPNSIAQKAALQALTGDDSEVEKMRLKFDERRKAGYERICKIADINVVKPQGAFYFYVDFSAYFGKKFGEKIISNCDELANYFLEDLLVASVPGSAFGSEAHIRFSYACSKEDFLKAMDRVEEGLAKLI